ncbi:hypothetical protein BDW02DRAFT_353034 [Decorospora gaudefroyi]|uniref:Transmembrane protein n=1 Tax=Decorospora gaudefroyi TaxID=184978 RepID=A0A6A5K8B0_9PLEO|nr:hypothetical protein BDW02DRAFT_353034 [Decorospora gaudefroyi]
MYRSTKRPSSPLQRRTLYLSPRPLHPQIRMLIVHFLLLLSSFFFLFFFFRHPCLRTAISLSQDAALFQRPRVSVRTWAMLRGAHELRNAKVPKEISPHSQVYELSRTDRKTPMIHLDPTFSVPPTCRGEALVVTLAFASVLIIAAYPRQAVLSLLGNNKPSERDALSCSSASFPSPFPSSSWFVLRV